MPTVAITRGAAGASTTGATASATGLLIQFRGHISDQQPTATEAITVTNT